MGARIRKDDLERPFARGTFRSVARGVYTDGPRRGRRCVIKWFHGKRIADDVAFSNDMKVMATTREVLRRFNSERIIPQRISLNANDVWMFYEGGFGRKGRRVLVEPFLENYRKWNSNNGWVDTSSTWAQIMQSLSHYSFHVTRGALVLCDLQGSASGNSAMLSDPAICSQRREYGSTDLGAHGIAKFFQTHKCSRFCHSKWLKPSHMNRVSSSSSSHHHHHHRRNAAAARHRQRR